MARRLEEATEEALFTGGRAGRRAVEDAGFSEELKERLLAKVKDAQFRSEHASAFAEAGLSSSAGRAAAQAAAAGQPWTGEERTEDAVLRMLDDAHKPLRPELRGKPRLPDLQPIDMRLSRRGASSPGQRAAGAREKAAAYTGMGMKEVGSSSNSSSGSTDDAEREARRKEFRERFRPAAREMPATLTGLASLANERIEDAIARGQFRNIPRGRGVGTERDARADNPFIDTTEYIMNKMIQRQDLVPPWIEKQQELQRAAHSFRTRLRNDWKRHAARRVASRGGTLLDQMARARRYAAAELAHNNPPGRRGAEQMAVPASLTDDPVMVEVRRVLKAELSAELGDDAHAVAAAGGDTIVTTKPVEEGTGTGEAGQSSLNSPSASEGTEATPPEAPAQEPPLPPPFRDPEWLRTEQVYMDLSIENLNTLCRSYNLMAPELARKPYFSLERELKACYADVAPQLADAIKERAAAPARRGDLLGGGDKGAGILDRLHGEAAGQRAKIYDSKAPHYGLREMWRDLFKRED